MATLLTPPNEVKRLIGSKSPILFLDQGSIRSGYVIAGGGQFRFGTQRFSGKTKFDRIQHFETWLKDQILSNSLSLVVYEGATTFTHRDQKSRLLLLRLVWAIEEITHALKCPSKTLHSHALKAAVADKARVEQELLKGLRPNRRLTKRDVEVDLPRIYQAKGPLEPDTMDALAMCYAYAKETIK